MNNLAVSSIMLVTCISPIFAEQNISPLNAYADRSYYTTEEKAVIYWSRLGGAGDNSVSSVQVTKGSGKILARKEKPGTDKTIIVPLKDVSLGTHWLLLELDSVNQPSLRCRVEVVKREPKPGHEWKIDRVNRVLLKEGEPHFPYGMIMYAMVAPRDEDAFKLVREKLGMNSIVRWYNNAPEQALEYHEMAAKYGLQVIEPMARFSKDYINGAKLSPDFDQIVEKNLPRIRTGIEKVRKHSSLMTYYNIDEPLRNNVGAVQKLYSANRELDGYHPTFVLYSSFVPSGEQFTTGCDILGVDPYWTPVGHGLRGNVNYVSKAVALCRQRADAARKVTWIVPMAELYSGIRKRPLLRQEQFCQSYLSLIHGAKGLIYFRYPVMHQQSLETLEALGKQMKLLGPIAITPEIEQSIDYSPVRFDPVNNSFPDVQVALKRQPSGKGLVLLAANTRPFPVDAEFHVSILGSGGKVTCLFRNGDLAVGNAAFKETIEPLGTRAYLLPEVGELVSPVQIAVKSAAHPERRDLLFAQGVPDTGRPGKRNLLANPGFEAASFRDWPDYYLFNPMRSRYGEKNVKELYGLDSMRPVEGKASLWMLADGTRPIRFYTACSPNTEKESKTYTLSGWMRADREGVKARFVGFGYRVPKPTFGAKEFTLTTEWRRYSETGTLPPNLPTWHSVGAEIVGKQPAKVWFDAMQLEAGSEATEYDP